MTSEAAIIAIQGPYGAAPAAESAELVERARVGDAGAFERLLRAHERQVVSTAWRLLGRLEDAEDAAQEVFLRLYRHLGRFDARRALEPWLYRVTVNVCRDLGRRQRRWPAPLEDSPEVGRMAASGPDPAARAALEEERRIVEEALRTLAEKERAALVLRDVEGLSTRQVAEVLGSKEVTVRSQICRARVKIKNYRQKRLSRSVP